MLDDWSAGFEWSTGFSRFHDHHARATALARLLRDQLGREVIVEVGAKHEDEFAVRSAQLIQELRTAH